MNRTIKLYTGRERAPFHVKVLRVGNWKVKFTIKTGLRLFNLLETTLYCHPKCSEMLARNNDNVRNPSRTRACCVRTPYVRAYVDVLQALVVCRVTYMHAPYIRVYTSDFSLLPRPGRPAPPLLAHTTHWHHHSSMHACVHERRYEMRRWWSCIIHALCILL